MPRMCRPAASLALLATLADCTSAAGPGTSTTSPAAPAPTTAATPATRATTSPSASTRPPSESYAAPGETDGALAGRVLRFTNDSVTVDVTIDADHATSRDLVSGLPLTLSFEEFAGREKISYLADRLDTEGSPGSEPDDGDLIYYKPWGNLGLYYNAPRGVDANVIQIGRFDASRGKLDRLTRGQVTVTMLDAR